MTLNDHNEPPHTGTPVNFYMPRLAGDSLRYLRGIVTTPQTRRHAPALTRWIAAQVQLELARRDVQEQCDDEPPEATPPTLPIALWSDRDLAGAMRVSFALADDCEARPDLAAFLRAVHRVIVIHVAIRLDQRDHPASEAVDAQALDVEARTIALRYWLERD